MMFEGEQQVWTDKGFKQGWKVRLKNGLIELALRVLACFLAFLIYFLLGLGIIHIHFGLK